MAKETLGRNITFPIYSEDGTSFHNLVLHRAVVDSVVMSLGDKITGDVYYKDNALDVTMHEYIMFKRNPNDANEDAVKYVIVSPPTIVREGMVSDNSELKGMTKYSFVFYHPMYVLNNIPFSDVAVTTEQERYLSQNKEFSWIGYPDDFIAKVNKNLQQTQWAVEKSSRFPNEKDSVLSGVLSFSNNTIADALKTWYDTWEIPYVIDVVKSGEQGYSDGKRFKIVFGLPSTEIYAQGNNSTPFVFQMGKGLGLKNNSRTPRNNKIITRISGYGSESNIPYGYPQIIWTGNQSWDYTINNASGMQTITVGGRTIQAMSYPIYDGIVGGQKVRLIKHPFTRTHLMPTVYSDTVNKKVNPRNPNYNPNGEIIDYYDAISSQEYQYPNEIDLTAPSYQIHEFDVKPEMNTDGESVGIVNAVPLNTDLTPADAWDDSIDDDGNFIQSYFRLDLPILPFDIYACASITEQMFVNMLSGACIGCTFGVQVDWDDYKRNFYKEDGTFDPVIHTQDGDGHVRDGSRYPDSSQTAISLTVQKDNETFGTIMPNVYQQPHVGDTFVILGISLPAEYITNAEEYLDEQMKSYMLENNVHYYDYPLKFDEYFLATHTNILAQIKPNAIVHFTFGDEQQLELYVKQLTVKFGQSVLPQYEITLTDNIEVVLNQIGQVADDVEKLSSLLSIMREGYSRNVWNEIAKKLSKVSDDTAKGKITFEKGAEFGTYNTGALGSGGAINIDQNGNSNAEFDFLTIRKAASFRTISILELKHVGGEMGLTAGAMKVSAVEELANAYRCYFDTSDGTKQVYQEFVVGDQARCQQFRLAQDSSGMLTTKYYWRLVTGVGDNYVDLSKTDADTGSGVPQAGDEVIQLGYRNNDHPERQSAIILSAVENQAPSIRYYQGINSYNLSNTIVKEDYYDPTTSLFHTNTYGESYVGAKDQSTYMKYTQANGVEIKGAMQLTSGTTLEDVSLTQIINNISSVANQAQADADAAQDAADSASQAATQAQSQAEQANQAAQGASDLANTANDNATTANGNATEALQKILGLNTGNENLLRNSGFTGDYIDESVTATTNVNPTTPMYSNPFDHWTYENADAISSTESVTGVAVVLSDGRLEQNMEKGVEQGKEYVFSFKANGTSLSFYVGAYETTIPLDGTTKRYNVKFTAPSTSQAFAVTTSTCTVMELQLIEGSVPNTDWINHPNDNDKTLAHFQNLTYLVNSIVNASTQILGGLVLTQLIKVGNYRNGTLQQSEETGGMSGLYNSGNSPFLWGGGTLEKAFYTIAKYAGNPLYQASDNEVKEQMAQFVVTHGGRAILNDIIARGFIIATSGIFKNIESPNGNFQIDSSGNLSVKDATISGNMYSPMLSITPENYTQYTSVDSSTRVILLSLSGFNVKLERFTNEITSLRLPTGDAAYKGAIVRIYNNSVVGINMNNIITNDFRAWGTLEYYEAHWDAIWLLPQTYYEFQCQYYPQYSYTNTNLGHSVITHTSSMQQIVSGLTIGSIVDIHCGIVSGNGGYKVMAGSTTLIDTTGSSDIRRRMQGVSIQYKVVQNQTTITANVADGSKLEISIDGRNSTENYYWTLVAKAENGGVKDLQSMMLFQGTNGVSVGYDPYINADGFLRFGSWTRPDYDDYGIHENG